MRGRRLALLAAAWVCAAAVVVAGNAPAGAREGTLCLRRPVVSKATRCGEPVLVEFNALATPRVLPARTSMPVGLRLEAVIKTVGGSLPPSAREITMDFDREASLDTQGLPTCSKSQIEKLGTVGAGRDCRQAIVGSGRAEAAIGTADTEVLDLTLFNAGRRAGVTTVLVHAATTNALGPANFVIPMKVRRRGSGPYGWEATAAVPSIPGTEDSVLLGFELNVRRLFSYRGRRQSYLSARCAEGRLQMSLGISFSDGTRLLGTAVRPCRPPLG